MKMKVNELNIENGALDFDKVSELVKKVFTDNQYSILVNGESFNEYVSDDNRDINLTILDKSGKEINLYDQFVSLTKNIIKLSADFARFFYVNKNPKIWNEIVKYIQLLDIFFSYFEIIVNVESFDNQLDNAKTLTNTKLKSLNTSFTMLMQSITNKNTVKIADILKWEIKPIFEDVLTAFDYIGGKNES